MPVSFVIVLPTCVVIALSGTIVSYGGPSSVNGLDILPGSMTLAFASTEDMIAILIGGLFTCNEIA